MQWGKEKRFILKCEYVFFRMIVYGYEILYTLFNIVCFFPPLDPVVLFLWCKADVFIVYGCFIAQYLCGVVLTSVMGWVCLDELFDLWRSVWIVRAVKYQ